jgi:putative transferase (TIGR04331 family)
MKTRILVTTALEQTWGDGAPVSFLGEWCKLYHRREEWTKLDYETLPHHWTNRSKLKKDHDYLRLLYERVLTLLAEKLNSIHNTNKSNRYWRIILGPWLTTYLPVMFDRWECLRVYFENTSGPVKTYSIINKEYPLRPNDTLDFIERLACSDAWNHVNFMRILQSQYVGKIDVVPLVGVTYPEPVNSSNVAASQPSNKLVTLSISKAMQLLDHLALRWNKIIIIGHNLNKIDYVRLSFGLGQIPAMYRSILGATNTNQPTRYKIIDFLTEIDDIGLGAYEDFEAYLRTAIIADVPASLFEEPLLSYQPIREFGAGEPQIIFTCYSHWFDDQFKFIAAESVERGTKLLVGQHGGALPLTMDYFNHDEDISDCSITWFKPYLAKQIQLPPLKLTQPVVPQNNRTICLVIGCELPRYVTRARSAPIAEENLRQFEETVELCKMLDKDARASLLIRPYPTDRGWATGNRYEDLFGADRVAQRNGLSLSADISRSKLIICTYPETTFAEAMLSGVPTILYRSPNYWGAIPEAAELIKLLKNASILFDDPIQAASHVNRVWSNVAKWWSQEDVLFARASFVQIACRSTSKWKSEWLSFFKLLSQRPKNEIAHLTN